MNSNDIPLKDYINHYIFVGRIEKVFDYIEIPARNGMEDMISRFFIASEIYNDFEQRIQFNITRRGRWKDTAGENFRFREGDWVKIAFTFKLREYEVRGEPRFENMIKVFQISLVDPRTADKARFEEDNPYEEEYNDMADDRWMGDKRTIEARKKRRD